AARAQGRRHGHGRGDLPRRAHRGPPPRGEGLRATRWDALRALPSRPRPHRRGARAPRTDLRLLHRGLRHARPHRGEGAARGARLRPGKIPTSPVTIWWIEYRISHVGLPHRRRARTVGSPQDNGQPGHVEAPRSIGTPCESPPRPCARQADGPTETRAIVGLLVVCTALCTVPRSLARPLKNPAVSMPYWPLSLRRER